MKKVFCGGHDSGGRTERERARVGCAVKGGGSIEVKLRKKTGREGGWACSLEGASGHPCVAGGRYSSGRYTSDDVLHRSAMGCIFILCWVLAAETVVH